MNVKQKVSGFVLDKALNYISGDPEKNLPKLLDWIDALGIKSFAPQSRVIHEVLDNPDNNWNRFIMGIWRDIDNDILKTVFHNFVLNMTRGAISKITAKLLSKGLIKADHLQNNKKEIYYVLTPQGKDAFEVHEKVHEFDNNKVKAMFEKYGPDELDAIARFLDDILTVF